MEGFSQDPAACPGKVSQWSWDSRVLPGHIPNDQEKEGLGSRGEGWLEQAASGRRGLHHPLGVPQDALQQNEGGSAWCLGKASGREWFQAVCRGALAHGVGAPTSA